MTDDPVPYGGGAVVVGAGIAGVRTVEALRSEGWTGPVTLVGAEPGLPHDLPPLSKQILTGDWQSDRARLGTYESFAAMDVRYIENDPAVGLDRKRRTVLLQSGAEVGFDALVLACGARAKKWPVVDGVDVHTIRSLADALRLRSAAQRANAQAAVVIGSGFVAAETAASLIRTNLRTVHLVCRGSGPCEQITGEPLAQWIRDLHTRNGVMVHVGRSAEFIKTVTPHSASIVLDDGTELSADVVVAGIGSIPNVDWVRRSGLPIGEGVLTDASGLVLGLRPGELILAVGDCAQWASPQGSGVRGQHWTRAVEQARIVGKRLSTTVFAQDSRGFAPTVPYVWSDQHNVTVQVIGKIGHSDELYYVDQGRETALAVYGRDRAVTGVVAAGLPRHATRIRRLLQTTTDLEEILKEVPEYSRP